MPNSRALLLTALLALGVAAPAAAQGPFARRGPQLAAVTQQLAGRAAVERPGSRFARVTARLAQAASTPARGRFDTLYVRARRLLVSERGAPPSDGLLDAWDAVVATYAPIRPRNPAVGPNVPPRRSPWQPSGAWSFQGSFEQTPVQLSGATVQQLEQSCLRLARSLDTSAVDDANIGGRNVHNGPGYWNAQALCSMVVLNATPAQPVGPAHVSGSIEGIPFSVYGTRAGIEQLLATHVPRLVSGMQVDDIELNGQHYRNGPSYWNPQQIVSLIVAQLAPAAQPRPMPPGRRGPGRRGPGRRGRGRPYAVQGTIENIPYTFTGPSAQQIDAQCQSFVSSAVTDWIDDIQINGRNLHNNSGWWNAQQVCEIISNQAQQR